MPTDEYWTDCPAGELAELQQSLKDQERRIRRRRSFLIAAGSAALSIAGGAMLIRRKEPDLIILSCREAKDLLPQYASGKLTQVATRKAVEVHLEHCPKCRQHFEATY
ncbi:zf-HC2 domain-containing protein [Bremerella sp. JC770]|uniref:zf-HC2 domain-containing protein n=1 Tax=Bremerella sp. JC770 TaxID=3232137 RepID=UPI0034595540